MVCVGTKHQNHQIQKHKTQTTFLSLLPFLASPFSLSLSHTNTDSYAPALAMEATEAVEVSLDNKDQQLWLLKVPEPLASVWMNAPEGQKLGEIIDSLDEAPTKRSKVGWKEAPRHTQTHAGTQAHRHIDTQSRPLTQRHTHALICIQSHPHTYTWLVSAHASSTR